MFHNRLRYGCCLNVNEIANEQFWDSAIKHSREIPVAVPCSVGSIKKIVPLSGCG